MEHRRIRSVIRDVIKDALCEMSRVGFITLDPFPDISVEQPAKPENGDFATSLPLRIARLSGVNPMEFAIELVNRITPCDEISHVWAAPPGFVNFYLSEKWLALQVPNIIDMGLGYGTDDIGRGKNVIVEFVSVNPTGPVHVGHMRGAVIGSALALLLESSGFTVTREYYINDAGSQMDAFYASVYARYRESLNKDASFPSNGYLGSYVIELAERIVEVHGDKFLINSDESYIEFGNVSRQAMLVTIKEDLQSLGVKFDNWFSEKSLYANGEYELTMNLLEHKGFVAEREGAKWFSSSDLGDEKDNVLIRSNGAPTYFASDSAYHYNKFLVRNFDSAINIWGADHQGHVSRLNLIISALGIDPSRLTIMISQMVSLKRGNTTVKASKRTGEFITLKELVEEVGSDACRYFFLSRTPSTHMEFDLELAKKQSSDNPVYYIQYGHARIIGILNNAREKSISWNTADVRLLNHPTELALIRKLVGFPDLIHSMSKSLEPHHLPHYAMDLAMAFHWFYENCRVISDSDEHHEIMLARLKLLEAVQIVLFRSLSLMGMSAPDRM